MLLLTAAGSAAVQMAALGQARAQGAEGLEEAGVPAAVPAEPVSTSGSRQKSVRIARTPAPPVIDGKLLDPVWANAAAVDDLHEVQPTEYAQASERTVIYLTHDEEALYIGVRLFDSEPERVTARILRQGEEVFGDDFFEVTLDTFNDRRSGYRFLTNPNGIRQEGLYQNVTDTQWEWQGIWDTAASIDAEGWVTEIAIPFKTLSFDPNNDTWGINFRRGVARRDERMAWVSRNRNTDPSTSGIVVGLTGIEQGMGLDVVASANASRHRNVEADVSDSTVEPSLDVFYKITPSLTSSLTINTDFSATDVDDRQVNLTRFDLFFPEKRDFFLQDADIFEFGGISENGRPFHSRSIGLSEDGDPVDLEVGGKLSGRLGSFNIGALAVRQAGSGGLEADNAIVVRTSANVLAESTVGVIVTEGNPTSALGNSLVGADFAYRNTRLPGGRLVESNVWVQRSDTEGIEGDDGAYGFRFASPNSVGFGGDAGFERIEENFNPALGFVNRGGIERKFLEVEYTRRPVAGFLRALQTGVSGERTELIAGGLQSQQVELDVLRLENRVGDELEVGRSLEKEVLYEPFEISDGVILPVGAYSFEENVISIETADQRRAWGDIEIRSGGFYGGERDQIELGVSWRPSGRFLARLALEVNDIVLPQGEFITRLAQFRTEVVFSSTLSWVTLVQYDNVSEIVGVNSRLHWIPQAGREGFVVFNHNLQDFDRDNRFHSASSDVTAKFGYTFRF
ncbi:MAG: carbohydrate binding family 9 domain-containing protein [Gammaproteobacteria bacterium]|nr:carbohydrate binding family 9 domain-containing protein [Gammaproteobacteria bacterium]